MGTRSPATPRDDPPTPGRGPGGLYKGIVTRRVGSGGSQIHTRVPGATLEPQATEDVCNCKLPGTRCPKRRGLGAAETHPQHAVLTTHANEARTRTRHTYLV